MIFRLDLGQITFTESGRKSVCNTTGCLSSHQHRVLVHCDTDMRRNQNFEILKSKFLDEKVTYVFRLFDLGISFSPFLFLLTSSSCCSD